jgi:thioredoxin-related protein
MKKVYPLLTLLIISASMFFTMDKEIETIKIGDAAPLANNKMESTKGGKISLLDVKEENGLLVIFSCNTCPFVVGGGKFAGWEKDYNAIYEMVSAKNIGMTLVNSNEAKRKNGDSMKDMKARSKEKSYSMHYVLDKNHELADAFGARTTPHVFLFDKDMKLVYSGAIDNTWNPAEAEVKHYLQNTIEEFSSNKTVSTPSTAPKGCSIKRKS